MAELSNRVEEIPERFVPAEARGELVEAEHLARYAWAAPLARDRRVLDAGCGMGYGTAMLARAGARSAVGVDIAEEVVEVAVADAEPGVELVAGDVRELPFDDASFDLVVCFETIEHIAEQDAAVAEFARVLAEDGVLVVSSPNPDAYPAGNPHHVRELRPDDLAALVSRHLPHVEVHRQLDWIGSAVLRSDDSSAGDLEPLDGMRVARALTPAPGSEPYGIVLGARGAVPAISSAMVLTGLFEVRRWLALWDEQQAVLEQQRDRIAAIRAEDDELRLLHQELRQAEMGADAFHFDVELDKARRDVQYLLGVEQQLRADITELLADNERLRAGLREIHGSAWWRFGRPLRAVRRLTGRRQPRP
jgi:SAM-dependent methyltransferase